MKQIRAVQIILIILISGSIGYFVGINRVSVAWNGYTPEFSFSAKQPPPSVQNVDFSRFWSVWEELQHSYYDKTKLSGEKMLEGAIGGMVESIGDPYTVYLPPTENTEFKDGLAGQFEGIGAELGLKDKQLIVVAPLEGSPAKKAGIRSGDAILAVDGDSTSGWTIPQAVEKIRGPRGEEVTLTVLHEKDDKPEDIKIVRDVITIKSVESWIKKVKDVENIRKTEGLSTSQDREVAYIRLSQFGDKTNSDWLSIVNSLSLQIANKDAFSGVILDLRNNPGGHLESAVFIASEFLSQGDTVVIEDGGAQKVEMKAERKGLLTHVPLVVLINKGSASASEIVAGALRDYDRARLVGDKSFGKGTIQQAEDLGNGAGLHITTAKWLTPSGEWIHEKGLTPDVAVPLDEKNPEVDTQLEKAVELLVE